MTTGDRLDVALELLDRHVVDCDGRPVGKVDDLDFEVTGDQRRPVLRALLIGPQALGRRLGGRLGTMLTGMAARAAGTTEPVVVPLDQVDDIGVVVRLRVPISDLPGSGRLETWLRDNFISRIPGAGRASG